MFDLVFSIIVREKTDHHQRIDRTKRVHPHFRHWVQRDEHASGEVSWALMVECGLSSFFSYQAEIS